MFLSSYELLKNRGEAEIDWVEVSDVQELKERFRAKFFEKLEWEETGNIIAQIRVKDTEVGREAILTLIDLIGFDQSFTEKIMDGETSIQQDSQFDLEDA